MKPILYETHVHTPLCGHANGHIDEYAAVAQQRGFRGLYVTEHCPMPDSYSHQGRLSRGHMDEYVQMVNKAAEEWGGRMDVLLGIECDWLPGMEQWLENLLGKADFHYVLGSIHSNIKDYQERFSSGSPLDIQVNYFKLLAQAAETGLFDALAHPDLIKNQTADDWQIDRLLPHIESCLDRIAATGVALEMNTHIEKKPIKEYLPSAEILTLMQERGIPVIPGGDAHEPGRVGQYFPEALRLLKETGYETVSHYLKRRRYEVPIDQALESLTFKSLENSASELVFGGDMPYLRKQSESSLSVMSYNILYKHDTKWGKDYRWPIRSREVFALVRRYMPDLIGLQEVTDIQLKQLRAALPEYRNAVCWGNEEGEKMLPNRNAVFYRQDRLRMLRSGWRWLACPETEAAELSEPPSPETTPGCADRHGVWAVYEDRVNGCVFFHINIHWPTGRYRETHPLCADAMVKIMDDLADGLPQIATGDFNNRENLLHVRNLADARKTSLQPPSGPTGSKVNRSTHEVGDGKSIDHILVSPEIQVDNFLTIDDRVEERYPSDHLPILASIGRKGEERTE